MKDLAAFALLVLLPNALPAAPRQVAPVRAEPFPASQVRLLPGPLQRARDIGGRYLLSLEPDRLLARYRIEAGLKPRAACYPDWEDQVLPGVGAGFALSGLAQVWAGTGDKRYLQRLRYLLDELERCQAAHGDGFLLATVKARDFVREIERGDIRLPGGWIINDRPEPYYAMEKLFSGLRDAYRVGGQPKALVIERRLADWLARHMSHLTDEQMQRIMSCEYGGMNWVLADLHADTGDARYLALSRRWDHAAVLDPLARGIDCLPGIHANTQFPKVSGLAARYPYTGAASDRSAARFFWDRVVNHHSYATGGNSIAEHFGPPDQLSGRLGPDTAESCNVYNMLRMSVLLFSLDPSAEYAEYMERALLNHVLPAQRADGRVCYFLPLAMGTERRWESLHANFRCCTCSAMDGYARIPVYLYARDRRGIFVNLFAASRVRWAERGIMLEQRTRFPDEARTQLRVTCARPTPMALRIRRPRWTGDRFAVRVNGRLLPVTAEPVSYLTIDRTWRTGDTVEVSLPMPLRLESMPDNRSRVAIFRGPDLMAGDLGTAEGPAPIIAARQGMTPTDFPSLVGQPLRCLVATGEVRVPLAPFRAMPDRRYTVYWDVVGPDEWSRRQEAARAEQARMAELDGRTIDRVLVGNVTSETAHAQAGEGSNTGSGAYGLHMETRWRDARGWFSYQVKVVPGGPLALLATYWGRELGARQFDVVVDGTVVATESLADSHPQAFYDVAYPLPAALLAGKSRVTVQFRARPGNMAGGLFGLRVVRVPPGG